MSRKGFMSWYPLASGGPGWHATGGGVGLEEKIIFFSCISVSLSKLLYFLNPVSVAPLASTKLT